MTVAAAPSPTPRCVAILADVHGNLPALRAVVDDVRSVAPDLVVVSGDMVNRGPDGNAVLDVVDALGWLMLLGNHDDLLVKWVTRDPSIPKSYFGDRFWDSTEWCAERLAPTGWLERIARLPLTLSIGAPDGPPAPGSVLVSHGSPRHYREGYGRHLADHALSEIVEMHPYDVLVGAHTHQPLERRWGAHLLLNTGAVGTPFNGDPRAQYLVLRRDGEGGRWHHEFRQVPYDRQAALDDYRRSGYLEAGGFSARIYWLELATARSWLAPFLMWTERNGAQRSERAWPRFLNEAGRSLQAPDRVGQEVVERSGLAVPS